MVKLPSEVRPFKVLVLGDYLLDAYTFGRVRRVSPEAPVPILESLKQESRPGGAGNVVLSLLALDAEVFVCGRVGCDTEGRELADRLSDAGADIACLHAESGYPTPVKNRLIAGGQQLLRVDREVITPLTSEVEEACILDLSVKIPQVEVVAISDYGKGFLTSRLTSATFQIARAHNIPVVVDPKGIDFTKYRGATLIKPNLSEAYAAAHLPFSATLEEVARELFTMTQAEMLLITRSEEGSSLFTRKGVRSDFPVRFKEVKDVTGAGDTVLSMLCLGMALELEMSLVAQLANVAAGIAIGRLGCAQVSLAELAERLSEFETMTPPPKQTSPS